MKALASPKHKALLVPYNPAVMQVIPHAKALGKYLMVPHQREESRLLRNLGYETPAPILTQYDWGKVKPFDSQRETAALLSMSKRAYVLSTMGTGKTRSALYAADHLMHEGQVRKCVIVAPLSTLTPTWMSELFTTFWHRKSVVVHHANRAKRLAMLDEPADFYIINHDGIQVVLPELLAKTDIDCVILDELSVYKDAGTDRWKITEKFIKGKKYVWGLTGSPTPNAPTDAYAQIKLLQPSKVTSFRRFRDATMYQLTPFKWAAKAGAAEYVHGLMQPSVRFRLEDCVDIPDTTYTTREVKLSTVQTKFYKRLEAASALAYANHQITAANEGVVRNKLMQVSCGYVYTDEGKILGLQPKAKLSEVDDIIDQTDRKVIVFVPYRHALSSVAAHIAKQHAVEVIDGSVSKKERDRIFYAFQSSDEPRVLVAHPRTMSHGLTLVTANTIVWFCPPDGLETYIQANARIVRPGQTSKTNIVHLQSTKVERLAYKRLQANESLQGMLLSMFDGVDDRG